MLEAQELRSWHGFLQNAKTAEWELLQCCLSSVREHGLCMNIPMKHTNQSKMSLLLVYAIGFVLVNAFDVVLDNALGL